MADEVDVAGDADAVNVVDEGAGARAATVAERASQRIGWLRLVPPRTITSPPRQSTSPSSSAATSALRNPSLASTVRIA
jgi:hypothetical protein